MASRAGHHLPFIVGREIVYCYGCQHEWYRESPSLSCPACGSDFVEIVDFENDPRSMNDGPAPRGMGGHASPHPHQPFGSDSDPEEGDIEELGYGFGSRPRPTPGARFRDASSHRRTPIDEGDVIFRRLAEILDEFGPARPMREASPGGFFPADESRSSPPTGTRIHQQTTFQNGPFGTTTRVTVTSGTFGTTPDVGSPNITTLLDQLFGSPFPAGDPARRVRTGPEPDMAFAGGPFLGGLSGLLQSLYNPQHGVQGDHVYTQEDFDRIISQLMEQSVQTNAPPPASQDAMDRLERKLVDDEILGPEGKAECTICIDELKRGQEVMVLPCKHWYHEECVVLWLREHNTCPMCRKPIEEAGGGPGHGNASGSSSSNSNNNNNNNNNSNFGGGWGGVRQGSQQGSSSRAERLNAARRRSIQAPAPPREWGSGAGWGWGMDEAQHEAHQPPSGSQTRRRSQHEAGGGGALGWLRDHWARGR
ncbi:hypothetical protein VTJ83DRAFT_4763 [Remersonia thermophila]|uniref:RING-type domain-containing protein n=1 Tax=Remersonia thermophila TaxID=72144 RepID=A0ABR4DCB9_9PEZI